MAVLSAFMWDPDWILNKVNVRATSLILVMQAKDTEEVFINFIHLGEEQELMVPKERTPQENVFGFNWYQTSFSRYVRANKLHA